MFGEKNEKSFHGKKPECLHWGKKIVEKTKKHEK